MSSARQYLRAHVRRGGAGALAVTLGLLTAGLAARALGASGGLPLGKDNLQETRTTITLAPGVKLTRISRGVNHDGRWEKAANSRIGSTNEGPWRVRVLAIDPRFTTGHLTASYGADIGRTETPTAMARFEGAVAGTNGGFFSVGSDTASRGDPVGLSIHDGTVESEPTSYEPETHFLLDAATETARVTKLRWRGAITHVASATTLLVNHVNEAPLVPPGCGLRRAPSDCDLRGQISVFTSDWGPLTPGGPGVEAVLDSAGCLVSTADVRGVRLRPGQFSVQATGVDALPLLELVALGCVQRTDTLTDPAGKRVLLTPSTFAVNGRYQLLREGKNVAPTGSDPFLARNPRTIAGVAADGRIILVTIDGRSRTSVGATLTEAAQVARSVGMVDALNLDGGGSTTMSVNGHSSGKPSDGQERPVGDALLYVPAPWRPKS